jgi:hypothetical protein
MTRSKSNEPDVFWRDVPAGTDAELGFACLTDTLTPVTPPAGLRERMLRAALPEERLARYAGPIAKLLEIDVDAARALIARIDDPSAWFDLLPGIALLPAPGGPSVTNALRGFVRVRAGVEFPEHEHLGDESVMIMQGYYADGVTGEEFGPGDVPQHAERSQHSFRVLADGPDLLGLVVAQGGLRAQGQTFLPF